MKLIINETKFEHITREIITAYFPKIKIETAEILPDDEDYVSVFFGMKNNGYIYQIEICIENRKYTKTKISKKVDKLIISKLISDVLKKITSIDLPWGILTGIRPAKMVRELIKDGYDENMIFDRFINEYDVHEDKAKLAVEIAKKEVFLISKMDRNAVSLYIGIPFCPTRCLYCSFTSQSIKFSNTLVEPYIKALFKEIDFISKYLRQNNIPIETVYIGGGTPTALDEYNLDLLCNKISESFDFASLKEYTVEAGRPDTITSNKLKILQNNGVSRISINPQTMNQRTLDIIGRRHTPKDIIKCYNMACDMGFKHINMDLIAGLPGETLSDFDNTLEHIRNLNPQSVTVHTMSIKHGSYLDMNYSMYTQTASDTVNNMLKHSDMCLRSLDKKPYYIYRQKNMLGNLENIGYCNENHECLYNVYIMEEVQSILSLGAGGSTKIVNNDNIERIFNVKEVSEYIKRIDEMIDRKSVILF